MSVLKAAASLLPATMLALVAAGVGAADLRPAPAVGEMAVVYAPWVGETDAMRAVVAAGGLIAGNSRMGNVVIAYSTDPDFSERAKRQGAWLTFAATGLCGPVVTSS